MKIHKPKSDSSRHVGLWWLAWHLKESAAELEAGARGMEDPLLREVTLALAAMRMATAYAVFQASESRDAGKVVDLAASLTFWAGEETVGLTGVKLKDFPEDPSAN